MGWGKSRAVCHEGNITLGWDADSGCTSLRQISMLPPKNPQLCPIAGNGHCSASPGNISNSNVFPSTLNNKASQLRPWVQWTKAVFPGFQCQEPSNQQGPQAWSQVGYQGSSAPRSPRIPGAWAPAISPAPGFFPTRRDSQHTPARPGAQRTLSGRSTARSPDQGHRATRKHSGPPLLQTNTVSECPLYDTRTLSWSLQTSALLLALGRPCRARRATAKSLARGLPKYLTWGADSRGCAWAKCGRARPSRALAPPPDRN